jgi:hypothetical protein
VTSRQYLAFLLRCLGYSEAEGDFIYDGVIEFAAEKGFLEDDTSQYQTRYGGTDDYHIEYKELIRFDCTKLSFFALTWEMKQGGKALADILLENGVFSEGAFTEGLWAFAQTYGVNRDGRIVRKAYSGNIELPWLGMSADTEVYSEAAWDFDDFLIAYKEPEEGCISTYAVGTESLEEKSKLSDFKISLADRDLRNGLLYYTERGDIKIPFDESQLTVKTYNWEKDEINILLIYDRVITNSVYGSNFASEKIIFVGIASNKIEYDVIDFDTGAIVNCISDDAGSVSAEFFANTQHGDNYRYSVFISNILEDETRCYICDGDKLTDSLIIPESRRNGEKVKIFESYDSGKLFWVAYINNFVVKIDRYKKMAPITDFDKGVVSAYCTDAGNIYVLPGAGNYGDELGVIGEDCVYSVLVPKNVIQGLEAKKITGISPDGSVTFIAEDSVGNTLSDVTTYVYDAASKKVAATGFTLGRPGMYPDVSPQERLEEIRQKLDELQK